MSETVEYIRLNPFSLESSETGEVYKKIISESGGQSFEAINETKVETIRLDSETVADVTYQFDFEAGMYVEQSRDERAEPLPPESVGRLALLEQEQLAVKLAIAELTSIGEQDKLDIQLALAELAGLIAGGE